MGRSDRDKQVDALIAWETQAKASGAKACTSCGDYHTGGTAECRWCQDARPAHTLAMVIGVAMLCGQETRL
jgi:hypothetical protein